MNFFTTNIENDTLENKCYRKVLHTNKNQQLVLMSLKPNEDIPMEVHDGDQFIRVEKGDGIAIIGETIKDQHKPCRLATRQDKYSLVDGSIIMIPAGTPHQIINKSNTNDLKLYTLYAPPTHKPKTINITKPKENEEDDEKYQHIDPNVCTTQKGGLNELYKRKYIKYKNKYFALRHNK